MEFVLAVFCFFVTFIWWLSFREERRCWNKMMDAVEEREAMRAELKKARTEIEALKQAIGETE